jgi:hypothetical protein
MTESEEFCADSGNAQCILDSLEKFEFIIALVVCQVVLDCSSKLSQQLQGNE